MWSDKNASERSALDIYKVYRSYIEHEDGLINQRTTWFIWLHSFLIATYGVIFSAYLSSYNLSAPPGPPFLFVLRVVGAGLLLTISVVGLFSSKAASASVSASCKAIDLLEIKGTEELRKRLPAGDWLPALTAGGSPKIHKDGEGLGLRLPKALIGTWVVSLTVPAALIAVALLSGPTATPEKEIRLTVSDARVAPPLTVSAAPASSPGGATGAAAVVRAR